MLNRSDTQQGISSDVVLKLDDGCRDEDTEELAGKLAVYIVDGWWALSLGDLRDFEGLIAEHRERAVASICSMISMAHAIRSGEGDAWVAETTGV